MAQEMITGIPQPNGSIRPEATMDESHLAFAISYMVSLPLDANVQFMTVIALKLLLIELGKTREHLFRFTQNQSSGRCER